jgi:hypothetical protein
MLTLLAGALAAYNALGLVNGLSRWAFLGALSFSVAPLYFIAREAVGMVFFGGIALGLWRGWRWARFGLWAGFPLYLALGWFERLTLARADYAHVNWPFALVWDVLACAVVWAMLWRAQTRRPPQMA